MRYVKPGKPTNLFNEAVAALARRGISVLGSRILGVRGRTSGELRTNPVNLLKVDGQSYLVAPRGHTQWVRNLRVAGEGTLRLGRKVVVFHPVELADADKPEILRAYLRRWWFEVGAFFGPGVNAKVPDEKLLEIAPGFPVFRITTA